MSRSPPSQSTAIPKPLIAFVRAASASSASAAASASTSSSPSPPPSTSTSTSTSSRKRSRPRSSSTGSRPFTSLPQTFSSTTKAPTPPQHKPIIPADSRVRPRSNRSKSRTTRAIESTLLALVIALVGERIRVELRNETEVRGRLDHVAPQMNLRLSAVSFKPMQRPVTQHDVMFIRGTQIRYVHIPDHIDVAKQLTLHENKLAAARSMYLRKKKTETVTATTTATAASIV